MQQKGINVTELKKERAKQQAKLIMEFGVEKLGEAKARLCSRCWWEHFCCLLPLTSEGKDCGYYKEEVKT